MTGRLTEAIRILASGRSLTTDEAADAVREIIAGDAADVPIAAFLTAARVRGETADELAGAVQAVLERMTPLPGPFPRPLLDTCGTGGDGASSINVSTATAIVCAAAGVPVAKHGNRSASGTSGSAEVLAELGVPIDAEPDRLAGWLRDLGITFLFAPRFHPALRHAASARRQLPFRTLFNLVGPLVNPARPTHQLIGVPDPRLARLVAETLAATTDRHAAVVTGAGGLDEVALSGPTAVLWVDPGSVTPRVWTPDDFGLPTVSNDALRITGPADSAQRLRALLQGAAGPIRDVVLANAAAALLRVGRADDLRDGVTQAARAIDSGAARDLLHRWTDPDAPTAA